MDCYASDFIRFAKRISDRISGGVKHIIMTKYCHYRFDLAVTENGRDVLIRIHGLLA